MKVTPLGSVPTSFLFFGGWLTFCLVLLVLGLLFPASVRADAGPIPTLTPTATWTPLPTLTPTFLPTWTPTPITAITVQVTPPLSQATEIPQPEEGGGLGGLVCWPLALGLILVIILVTLILFGRGRFT